MIDTLKFTISRQYINEVQINSLMANTKIEWAGLYKEETGTQLARFGKLRNIRIAISKTRVTLEGSLLKFYRDGYSFDDLDTYEILDALRLLQRLTGLPIYRGDIVRIDIAKNFEVLHKPKAYLKMLEAPNSSYGISKDKGSVKIRKSGRTSHFYDKKAEIIEKQKEYKAETWLQVRQALSDIELLRYEEKIEGNVNATLKYIKPKSDKFGKTSRIKVVHLMSHRFRQRLVEYWKKEYHRIPKRKFTRLKLEFYGVREFAKYLCLAKIDELGGYTEMMSWIDYLEETLKWSYHSKRDIEKFIKESYNTPKLRYTPKLVYRLDEMVENTYLED